MPETLTFFADLVAEMTRDSGTGAFDLQGALPGRRTFADAVPSGAVFDYAILGESVPAQWETGQGVLVDGQLQRTPRVTSAGGTSPVDFYPGLKTVMLVASAQWFAAQQARLAALEARTITGTGLATGGGALTESQEISVPKATSFDLIAGAADNKAVTPQSLGGSLKMSTSQLPKTFGKLFDAYAGSIVQIKALAFGDSMAQNSMVGILPYLNSAIGAEVALAYSTNFTGEIGSTMGKAMEIIPLSGTANKSSNAWDLWVTGELRQLSAGGSFRFTQVGGDPHFTKIVLYYIKEPGAGTMTLKVGGTTIATIDANAASISLGIYEYTQAGGQAQVIVDVATAIVNIVEFHRVDTRYNGIDYYLVAKGGIALNAMLSTDTGRANFAAYLAHVNPDLTTFEMKEESGYLGAELEKLGDILDANNPLGDKLFCGSTPVSIVAADNDQRLQNTIIEGFALARGYAYFDKYKPFIKNGNPTTAWTYLNALGWGGDGTHVATQASAYTGKLIVRDMGLMELGYAFNGQAVFQKQRPSYFGRGSRFGLSTGRYLTVNTDPTWGLDWTIATGRMVTIQSDAGTVNTQFSFNTGIHPNVRPISTDFVSAGNVRKMDTSTSGTGIEYTRMRKTDNPGGGFMHMQSGLIRNGFTRAELLAINATSNIGAMAFCTDCTGGAQWAYAKGASATDWVTVDGKAAI